MTDDESDAFHVSGGVKIFKTDFRPMKHTISGNPSRMFMKLVVRKSDDRVIGCHIVGSGASEMIQCIAVAVKAGATKNDFDSTVALHPTSAEELVLMSTPSNTLRE